MRKDWKYIAYVAGAIGLYVFVKLLSPKQFDWSVTLAHDDRDPYGTYVFHELLPEMFAKKRISHSYRTVYELKDSLGADANVVILASRFSGDKEDTNVLLEHVNKGGTVFISAQYYWGHFADTLDLNAYDYFFKEGDIFPKDTAHLKFCNVHLDTTLQFFFRRDNIHNYFERFDTTRTTVIARNDYGQPITIRMTWGKGNFILNTTPLAFTNIYMLAGNNADFVAGTLSCLPEADIQWTEFYHLGRMESGSPLRFILTNEPLTWAYYITIGGILIFMIFEAKRKQRIIPVIKPLANTSLEFVSTIGNLYYQHGDHKNMAEKKINFLMEQIRSKYRLRTNQPDDAFFTNLARKSGNRKEEIEALFRTIAFILSSTMISPGQLMDLNDKIEKFNAAGNDHTV